MFPNPFRRKQGKKPKTSIRQNRTRLSVMTPERARMVLVPRDEEEYRIYEDLHSRDPTYMENKFSTLERRKHAEAELSILPIQMPMDTSVRRTGEPFDDKEEDENIEYTIFDEAGNTVKENPFVNALTLRPRQTKGSPMVRKSCCHVADIEYACQSPEDYLCAIYYEIQVMEMIRVRLKSFVKMWSEKTIPDLCKILKTLKSEERDSCLKYLCGHKVLELDAKENLEQFSSFLFVNNLRFQINVASLLTFSILKCNPATISVQSSLAILQNVLKIVTDVWNKRHLPISHLNVFVTLGYVTICFVYIVATQNLNTWTSLLPTIDKTMDSYCTIMKQRVRIDFQSPFCSLINSLRNLNKATVPNIHIFQSFEDCLKTREGRNDVVQSFDGAGIEEKIITLFLVANHALTEGCRLHVVEIFCKMVECTRGREDSESHALHLFAFHLTGRILLVDRKSGTDIKQIENRLVGLGESTFGTVMPDGLELAEELLCHPTKASLFRTLLQNNVRIHHILEIVIGHLERKMMVGILDIIRKDEEKDDSDDETNAWMEYEGTFYQKDCHVRFLVPPLLKEDKRQVDDSKRKAADFRDLDILVKLSKQESFGLVKELLAYSYTEPTFYITENFHCDTLQSVLLSHREDDDIIPIGILIDCIVQAFRAVSHVHRCHIIHRGITSAVFKCQYSGHDAVKLILDDFQTADYLKKVDPEFLKNSLTDLQFNEMPTRWTAPESFLYGTYNARSDVWMCCMLAEEILNHGAWPFSEFGDFTDEVLMKNVVFTNLRPQGNGRPECIHSLLLEGLHRDPMKRMTLQALETAFVKLAKDVQFNKTNAFYENVAFITREIPEISPPQRSNSKPTKGVPKVLQHYRASDQDPDDIYISTALMRSEEVKQGGKSDILPSNVSSNEDPVITRQEDECFTVEDKVTREFTKDVYPHLRELDKSNFCVLDTWPPKLKLQRGTEKLVCRYPESMSLIEAALTSGMYTAYGEQYIPFFLKIAKFIAILHKAGWILRCVRAKYLFFSKAKEQVFTIKMGSLLRVNNKSRGQPFQTDTFKSCDISCMKRWFPIEVLTSCAYSQKTDVYSFGMMVWEVCKAIDVSNTSHETGLEGEFQCFPFNDISDMQLLHHLVEGNIPKKPSSCPPWLYQEVIRPSLRHQRIDRPSMEDIVCILQKRTGIDSIYVNDEYEDDDDDDDEGGYEDIDNQFQALDEEEYTDINPYEDVENVVGTNANKVIKGLFRRPPMPLPSDKLNENFAFKRCNNAEPPPVPKRTYLRNILDRVKIGSRRSDLGDKEGNNTDNSVFYCNLDSSSNNNNDSFNRDIHSEDSEDNREDKEQVYPTKKSEISSHEEIDNYSDVVDTNEDDSTDKEIMKESQTSQVDETVSEKTSSHTKNDEEGNEKRTSVAKLRLLFTERDESDTRQTDRTTVMNRRITTAQAPVKRTENKE